MEVGTQCLLPFDIGKTVARENPWHTIENVTAGKRGSGKNLKVNK
jgi:hypothetical protein